MSSDGIWIARVDGGKNQQDSNHTACAHCPVHSSAFSCLVHLPIRFKSGKDYFVIDLL